MVSDNFSGLLYRLANVPNADVKVQVHSDLMSKNKKSGVQKSYARNIHGLW